MICIIKAKRTTFFCLLLLLSHLSIFAQDAERTNSAPQQNNPFGRLEVPDSEEQRRFVEEHSFDNPLFRQKQRERENNEAMPLAQASKQVRIIYLVPADKSFRADYESALANAISDLQVFYRNQLGGVYAFALHSPIVEVYQTPHPASFYSTGNNARAGGFWESVLGDGFALTGGGFNDPNNRWIFYVDADLICGQYTGGTSGIALLPANDFRGLTNQPTVPICPSDRSQSLSVNRWIGGLGHELGHAFNLPHPPGCDNGNCTGGQYAYNSLMYIGYLYYPGTYLLDENKSLLLAGGFFSAPTYDISGRITDSNNSALAGATVTINETQATVASDANGNFDFTGLPFGGSYTVSVSKTGYSFTPPSMLFNNLNQNQTANFIATNLNDAAPTIQLSATSYQVGEADGHATIIVNRSNSTSAASVSYATSDTAGLTPCQPSPPTGAASSRCDYATSVGRLQFAAGESSKTIFIPLVNDSYAEGVESFSISLSDPTGASLGSISTATITITDDDAATSGNPIVDSAFFVREHYIDFLGREPDPAGFAGWQNILNNCPPSGRDANGNFCDRIEVSAGFFRSPEFQDRGYFIYRFYSTSLGRIPRYSEFMPDLAKVSGFLSPEQLEANKVTFVQEFMARTEFRSKYDSLTTPTAYVDGLLQTAGLQNHPLRDAWITLLTNGTATRAEVLRALAESLEVYNKFYNESFVVMQYFGYLRRDPDSLYLEWIKTMNSNGGDYRAMINGFVNSSEYLLRFGP